MKVWFKRLALTGLITIVLTPPLLWLADKIWPLPLDEVVMARTVTAEDGSPLWRFADSNGVWRYPVTLKDVSPEFIEALLTYEDRYFYQHPGINPVAIGRAALQDLTSGRIVSGGSTLSMQVARLLDPHDRTLTGKLKQVFRTIQLEWHYSKDEILEMYLNRAPYGGTVEGIGAASWMYLGKPPSELTAGEAALLAVLPQAPSRLRPDRYPQRAEAARNKVLDRLAEFEVWPQSKVNDLKQESIWLAPRQVPHSAPLLARRVAQGVKDPVIRTTINPAIQRQLEEMARNRKYQLPEKTSLGIMVVDNRDMSVKGYVGSIDFSDDTRFGHVDVNSAWRSPGSTLKPFLYALAMDEGLIHSESLLQDVPRRFNDYRPGNFDTGFSGPVSVSEALRRSLNLPVVQLLDVYGPKRFSAKLRNVGLELRFPLGSDPNLSLILGGTGARMDQLIAAYSAFARQGKVAPVRFRPEDPLAERQLISPGAAWITRRVMAGETRPLADDRLAQDVPLAWKTGTSYGYRDAWALGVNNRYTIGVWVGRPDGTPVAGQAGFATAIPILYQVDSYLRARGGKKLPDPKPISVSSKMICWPSGLAADKQDPNCRQQRIALVLDNTVPPTLPSAGQESLSGTNAVIWVNGQGERVSPDCPDAQEKTVALWPIALESWLPPGERRSHRLPPVSKTCPPLRVEAAPLLISGIREGDVLRRLPLAKTLDLRVVTQGGEGTQWWFLNGDQAGSTESGEPLLLTLDTTGHYQLTVLDLSGQVSSVSFTLK